MSMNIGTNYNSTYSQQVNRTKNTQATQNTSSNNDYLGQLSTKYPNANITVGNYAKNSTPGSGLGNVMIAPSLLKEMENDPAKAAKYEKVIANVLELEKSYAQRSRQEGREVVAHGSVLDKDGNVSTWGVVRTANPTTKNDKKSFVSTIEENRKKQVEKKKELDKLLEKKREQQRINESVERKTLSNQYNNKIQTDSIINGKA